MTEVIIRRDGQIFYVSAQGHATGSVEVCAAVSALMYTLDGYLNNAPVRIYEERFEPGDVLLRFEGGVEAETAFNMTAVGLQMLELSFPDHVSVYLST
jgi:uncharacterized protein YsxB (DUF464 family)